MKFIILPLKFIKFKNGMWFYMQNLLNHLLKNNVYIEVWCSDWQYEELKKFNIKRINSFNLFIIIIKSYINNNIIVISPTLRPIFAAKQYVIMHDAWPLIQQYFLKKYISKLLFYLARKTSRMIFVSKHHFSLFGRTNDFVIYNELEFFHSNITGQEIYCDILIIGTETDRKQLNKLDRLINSIITKGMIRCDPSILLVGTIPPNFNSIHNVKYLDSSSLNQIRPNNLGIYVSASLEEGFNRGAAIAKKLGFQLILSDIGAHKEFYPSALFFDKNLEYSNFYTLNLNANFIDYHRANKIATNNIINKL